MPSFPAANAPLDSSGAGGRKVAGRHLPFPRRRVGRGLSTIRTRDLEISATPQLCRRFVIRRNPRSAAGTNKNVSFFIFHAL